mgnify:CR=1 FL=1|jgi:Glycosyltransferase
MTTLRVILDQMIAPVPGGIGRYTEEIARELVRTTPRSSRVEGVVSASPEPDYATIHERVPGLAALHKSALARRELAAAWQHGFTRLPGSGMIHAPSLFAPLRRHDRSTDPSSQIVVTIHDAVPWTHPETLTPRGVSWHRSMAKRAARFADAIVVPTHAVADELAGILDLGDRVRVIGGAPSSRLAVPRDADDRAAAFELPERFVLSVGTLEPRKGLEHLIRAMASVPDDVELLIVGPPGWGGLDVGALAADAGVAARVRTLGRVDDPDLAVLLDRADVFAFPSLAEGFGLPVIEAFALGTPVVHSDAPAVLEVSAGAGLAVELGPLDGYATRLGEAIRGVLEDADLAARLRTSGADRAKAFTWHDSAEKVWQLHADL